MDKMNVKNRIVIIVALGVILVCFPVFLALIIYSGNIGSYNIYAKTYNAEIEVESVNNTQLTNDNLIKIGDKLYFNYKKPNLLTYGTYEISSNGAKRISWGIGPVIRDTDDMLEPITVYNGLLVSDRISYDCEKVYIKGFNGFFHNFSNQQAIDSDGAQCDYIRLECVENKNYFITSTNVYEESDGKLSELIDVYDKSDEKVFDYKILNIQDDSVYYAKGRDNNCIISSCNINTNLKKELCSLSVECQRVEKVFSYDNKLVVEVGYGYEDLSPNSYLRIYLIDILNNKASEVIYENNGSEYFGDSFVYDGVLYYADSEDNGGIYAFDLHNESKGKLYDGHVESIHILDSKWIYFTDDKAVLYRITHDGKTLENVFG